MRPTGLGNGEAGDDKCTLSMSPLLSFWKRVSCLFVVWLKNRDKELSCDSCDFGELIEDLGKQAKWLDELLIYSLTEKSDDCCSFFSASKSVPDNLCGFSLPL